MKKFYLLHLGAGNVGRELIKQITENKLRIKKTHGIEFIYYAAFTSKGGIVNAKGLSLKDLQKINPEIEKESVLEKAPKPLIVIDTTASDQTIGFLIKAAKQHAIVLSNKKPLSATQKTFDILTKTKQFFFETTVGAGLPVISTLRTLLETGDEIVEMQGTFSGTLGFICSNLEKGEKFSQVVKEAKEKGFTEPDPRDDLSGMDVARKALILARLSGQKREISDIRIEKLFPSTMEKLSIDAFMNKLTDLDKMFKQKFENAVKAGKTFRYVATITDKKITVGLKEVSKTSFLGNLNGPENIVIIKTKRYFDYPLIVSGPGAGIEVTAAGVFGDILHVVGII